MLNSGIHTSQSRLPAGFSRLPASCIDCGGLDAGLIADCILTGCPFSDSGVDGGAFWAIDGEWAVNRGIEKSLQGIEA